MFYRRGVEGDAPYAYKIGLFDKLNRPRFGEACYLFSLLQP